MRSSSSIVAVVAFCALGAWACGTQPAALPPSNTGGQTGSDAATDATTGVDTAAGATATDAVSSDTTASDTTGSDAATGDTLASGDGDAAVPGDTAVGDTVIGDTGGAVDTATGDTVIGDTTTTDTATDSIKPDGDAAGDTTTTPVAPTPPATTVKLPYTQAFDCSFKGWALSPPESNGVGWAIDATPTVNAGGKAFVSPPCSLNFNGTKDFACPTGAKSVGGYAVGELIDASALAATANLAVQFQLGGNWESNEFDNLDLESSLDDKAWKVVKSYDPPSGGNWMLITEPLSGYAGKKFRLRLRFWTKDCAVNNGVGPFVDDWKVYDATCKSAAECDDKNPCTDDKCDSATGKCSNPANTAPCDDGNACTEADKCGFGSCSGKGKSCDDGNTCTDDSCDKATGKCASKPKPAGAFCSDGNDCTTSDKCSADAKCTAGAAAKDGADCYGEDGCLVDQVCKAGVCQGGGSFCDDDDPCTNDACSQKDPETEPECKHTPAADGAKCDDGIACTSNETCKAGTCTPGTDACGKPVLTDTFECGKNNGWTFSAPVGKTGWAIDDTPAKPEAKSPKCSLNFNNGTDYVEKDAKGNELPVAGTATSAEIALPAGPNGLLKFWSYHGVEQASGYDQRIVEVVADGKVQKSLTLDNTDTKTVKVWVQVTLDISALAGKKIQVRFRFDSKDDFDNKGVGWLVDDLTVQAGQ
jgi:hypothetical protein